MKLTILLCFLIAIAILGVIAGRSQSTDVAAIEQIDCAQPSPTIYRPEMDDDEL